MTGTDSKLASAIAQELGGAVNVDASVFVAPTTFTETGNPASPEAEGGLLTTPLGMGLIAAVSLVGLMQMKPEFYSSEFVSYLLVWTKTKRNIL